MRASPWLVRAIAAGAVLVVALQRPASAEDGRLGAEPWYPFLDPEKSPEEVLERNALAIVRIGDEGWRVNRGSYRSLVSRRDFYVTLGRGDLARREAKAEAWSSTLFWSGVVVMSVGTIVLYTHGADGGLDPGLPPGLIVFGGGLALMLSAGFFTPPNIPADEAVDMVERYNQLLKLHIEREMGVPKPKPVQASAPRIVPWTDGRSGGGFVMLATF
jgi:hypothetical protein